MLRFNQSKTKKSTGTSEFQYILCYGSTKNFFFAIHFCLLFQYILCYGSTGLSKSAMITVALFQYILCYGSTDLALGT